MSRRNKITIRGKKRRRKKAHNELVQRIAREPQSLGLDLSLNQLLYSETEPVLWAQQRNPPIDIVMVKVRGRVLRIFMVEVKTGLYYTSGAKNQLETAATYFRHNWQRWLRSHGFHAKNIKEAWLHHIQVCCELHIQISDMVEELYVEKLALSA